MPRASEMQHEFWDRRAKKYDDEITRHGSQYTRTVQGTGPYLADSDRVLDVGCGSGEICLGLASRVEQVHGIDTSGRMIELARQKARARDIENACFSQSDAFDTSLESGSFSVITAFNVLHLVEKLPGVLARLHDLLTPAGILISQTPCLGERGWIFRSMVSLAQRFQLAPPIQSLTFRQLESLIADSGLEILVSELSEQEDAIQRVVARKRAALISEPA